MNRVVKNGGAEGGSHTLGHVGGTLREGGPWGECMGSMAEMRLNPSLAISHKLLISFIQGSL